MIQLVGSKLGCYPHHKKKAYLKGPLYRAKPSSVIYSEASKILNAPFSL